MLSDDKGKGKKSGKKNRGKKEDYMDEGRKRRMTNKRQSERGRRWKKKKKDMANSFPGKVSSRLCASDPSNRIIPNCGLFY